jgi:hypothetical protein
MVPRRRLPDAWQGLEREDVYLPFRYGFSIGLRSAEEGGKSNSPSSITGVAEYYGDALSLPVPLSREDSEFICRKGSVPPRPPWRRREIKNKDDCTPLRYDRWTDIPWLPVTLTNTTPIAGVVELKKDGGGVGVPNRERKGRRRGAVAVVVGWNLEFGIHSVKRTNANGTNKCVAFSSCRLSFVTTFVSFFFCLPIHLSRIPEKRHKPVLQGSLFFFRDDRREKWES